MPLKGPVKDFNQLFTDDFVKGGVSSIEDKDGNSYFMVINEVMEPNQELLKAKLKNRLESEIKIIALNQYLDSAKDGLDIEIKDSK